MDSKGVDRCGSKLLGQRPQIKNRIESYLRSVFQVRVAVAVHMNDSLLPPNSNSDSRNAILRSRSKAVYLI